jgi:hypothetical protein
MNERIKELMIEAFQSHYGDPVTLVSREKAVELVSGWGEKFAELIVQECLKIAKNREDEFESAGLLEQSNAVGNVAYRISRQFGVKR